MCLATALTQPGAITQPGDPDPQVLFKKFFARLPRALKHGYPKQGVPSQEPWRKSNLVTYYNDYSSGNVQLIYNDISLKGLSKFKVHFFGISNSYKAGQINVNYMVTTKHVRLVTNFEGSQIQSSRRTDFNGSLEFTADTYIRNATFTAYIVNGRYVVSSASENWNGAYDTKVQLNMAPGSARTWVEKKVASIFYDLEKLQLASTTDVANVLLSRLQNGIEDEIETEMESEEAE
jgi:hypothetical protein